MKPVMTKMFFVVLAMCFSVPAISQAQTQVELPQGDVAALLAPPPVKPTIISCACSLFEQGTVPGETSKYEYNILFGSRLVKEKVEVPYEVYTIEMVTRDANGFGKITLGKFRSQSSCDLHVRYDMPACPKGR
jgi:hypothetical protein